MVDICASRKATTNPTTWYIHTLQNHLHLFRSDIQIPVAEFNYNVSMCAVHFCYSSKIIESTKTPPYTAWYYTYIKKHVHVFAYALFGSGIYH